ncbi:partial sulfate transport system ATP-binding protein, partial [Anaerolineae bacterium]
MAEIKLEGISKQFGATSVVREIDLTIPDKEFVVLLGPSGSGKSTILRMIAGLEKPSAGKIYIGDRRVDPLEPKERNIAFVFQTYALYPHMTVERNIAFPLMMRHWKWYYHLPILSTIMNRRLQNRPEIKERVQRAAEILGLTEYMKRKPKQLSGGQRQRVAVGRAIVRDPAAYLMDEPLSNLDAKLRGQMRSEIISLYNSVQTTFVYVTHDQVEAMTMGTRIVVLHNGIIQQYDTPKRIFDHPVNVFVAQFIGSPPMNIFHCQVLDQQHVKTSEIVLPVDGSLSQMIGKYGLVGKEVLLGVRPERVSLSANGNGS